MATRRESVRLELEDHFTGPLARAAATTKAFEKTLRDLDGTTVKASDSSEDLGDSTQETGNKTRETTKSTKAYTLELAIMEERSARAKKAIRDQAKAHLDAAAAIDKSGNSSRRAGSDIDKLSGRLQLLARVAGVLGPALVPIGAVGIAGVAGLASAFGTVALGAGTAVLAFQGVGDALKAMNAAALEPTAANLAKAQIAMGNLAPEAREFVRELRAMQPQFTALRDAAAAGFFPGMVEALDELEGALPKVEAVLHNMGDAMGGLMADSAESLAGPRWENFLNFAATELPSAMTDLGRAAGSMAHGFAEMWAAFGPLNADFNGWLLDGARGFDQWATGLSKTQGFQEFVAYIREMGPLVQDALGSIGEAMLQIAEATAPLGGPVLQALTAVADAIATVAGSDAGPSIMATVTALSALRLGMQGFSSISSTSWATAISGADTFGKKMDAARGPMLRGASAMAGIGLAASGVASGFGLANTATGAMIGMIGGPWGAAVGGAVGLVLDLAASNDDAAASVAHLAAMYDRQTGAITENVRAEAVSKAQKDGLLDAAGQLGLQERLVTEAILGSADAQERLNSALAGYEVDNTITSVDDLRASYSEQEIATILANRAATTLRNGIPALVGQFSSAKGEAEQFARGMGGVEKSFDRGASAAEKFTTAVARANRALSRRGSFRDYEAALDDFAKAFRDLPKKAKILNPDGSINITIPKGREIQGLLDGIATSALKVAENLKGADRARYLRRARQDFVDAATKLLGSREAARQLANELGLLNQVQSRPTIDVQSNARFVAADTRSALANINDETVWVNVVRRQGASTLGPRGAADGDTVPGRRFPYGDRVPYLLAPGEEVISNRYGQADRSRELLKAINANRLADGGTARMRHASSSQRLSVDFSDVRVSGSIGTPYGAVDIAGVARAAAREEIAAQRSHDNRMGGMRS